MLGSWYVFGYEGFPKEDRRRFYSQRDDPCDSDEERRNNPWASNDSRCFTKIEEHDDEEDDDDRDSQDDDDDDDTDTLPTKRGRCEKTEIVQARPTRDADAQKRLRRSGEEATRRRRRRRRGPPMVERVVNMGMLSEAPSLFGHTVTKLLFPPPLSVTGAPEVVALIGGVDLVLRRPTDTIALFEKRRGGAADSSGSTTSLGWQSIPVRQACKDIRSSSCDNGGAKKNFHGRYAHCSGSMPGNVISCMSRFARSDQQHPKIVSFVLTIGGIGKGQQAQSPHVAPLVATDIVPSSALFLNEPTLLAFERSDHESSGDGNEEDDGGSSPAAVTGCSLVQCKNMDCINAPSPRAFASLCPWTKFISHGGEIVSYSNRFAYFGGTSNGRRPLSLQEGGGLQLLVVDVLETVLECTEIPTIGLAPTTRFGHSATCANDAMYIYGGIDASGQVQNSLHVLDYCTCVWREAYIPSTANVPSRAFHAALWAPWSCSLIFAGGEAYRGASVGSSWEYCITQDAWFQVSFPLLARTDRDAEAEYATHSGSRESSVDGCSAVSSSSSLPLKGKWIGDECHSPLSSSTTTGTSHRHTGSSPTQQKFSTCFDGKETLYALHQRTLPPCQQQQQQQAFSMRVKTKHPVASSQSPLETVEQLSYASLLHGSQAAAVTCDDGLYLVGGTSAPFVMTLSRIRPAADAGSLKFLAAMAVLKLHALLPSNMDRSHGGSPSMMMTKEAGAKASSDDETLQAQVALNEANVVAKQQQARELLQQWKHAADYRRQTTGTRLDK